MTESWTVLSTPQWLGVVEQFICLYFKHQELKVRYANDVCAE